MENLRRPDEDPQDVEWRSMLFDLSRSVSEMTHALAKMRAAVERLDAIGSRQHREAAEVVAFPQPTSPQAREQVQGPPTPLSSEPPVATPPPSGDTGLAGMPARAVEAPSPSETARPATASSRSETAPRDRGPAAAMTPSRFDWRGAEPKPWMPKESQVSDRPGPAETRPAPEPANTPAPPANEPRDAIPPAVAEVAPPLTAAAGLSAWTSTETGPEAAGDAPPEAPPSTPGQHDGQEHHEATAAPPGSGWASGDEKASEIEPENEPEDAPPALDIKAPEDARERVRRLVEMTRADLDAAPSAYRQEAEEPRLEVGANRMELDDAPALAGGDLAAEPATVTSPDPEALREQVRLAVEMARAELSGKASPASGSTAVSESMDPKTEAAPSFSMGSGANPAHEIDDFHNIGIPTIVVENPSGRVELLGVYEMLSLLDCATTANLVNYLPYSVTITIDEANLPEPERIERAAASAFGRACHLVIDGRRITVRLAGLESHVA